MARYNLTFENNPVNGSPPVDNMVVYGDALHLTSAGQKLGSDIEAGDKIDHGGSWITVATTTLEV
jgi:hypothetical protein